MKIKFCIILSLVYSMSLLAAEIDYDKLEIDFSDTEEETGFNRSYKISQLLGYEAVSGLDTISYMTNAGVVSSGLLFDKYLVKADMDITFVGASGAIDVNRTTANIQNLYIQNEVYDWTLTIGYQTLNWSEMNFFTSLNVISPNAPIETSVFASDQGTIGQPMIHLKKFLDQSYAELFINVDPKVSRLDSDPVLFVQFNSLIGNRSNYIIDEPNSFSDLEYGFRLGTQINSHEVNFMYSRLVSNDLLVISNDNLLDTLEFEYPEYDFFALSGNQPFGPLLFTYEVSLSQDHALSFSDNPSDIWTYATGFEYSFNDSFSTIFEVRHAHFDTDSFVGVSASLDAPRHVDNLSLSLNRAFMAGDLSASYVVVWDSVTTDLQHIFYSVFKHNDKLSFDFLVSKGASISSNASFLDDFAASIKLTYAF